MTHELTLIGHLRRALDAIDVLRNLLELEDREDREQVEHELAMAETAIRHVLRMVAPC